MSEQLLPCPFCLVTRGIGARGQDANFREGYAIECMNCGAIGPWRYDQADAIAAWNRRAAPASNNSGGTAAPSPAALRLSAEDIGLIRHVAVTVTQNSVRNRLFRIADALEAQQ